LNSPTHLIVWHPTTDEKMEKEKEEKGEKPGLHDDTAASSSPWWSLLSFSDAPSLLQHVVRACASCLMDLCGGGSAGRGSTDAHAAAAHAGHPAGVRTLEGDTSEEGGKATHVSASTTVLRPRFHFCFPQIRDFYLGEKMDVLGV
jgi:hypothetical protein